jgi:hypothetical protein
VNKVSCSDFYGHQKFVKKHRREEFHIIISALARFKFRKIKFTSSSLHHDVCKKVSCSDFCGHQKFVKKHRREGFHIITKIQNFIFIDLHHHHFIEMFMNKVSCSDFCGHQKFRKKHRREEFDIITKIQNFIFIDSSTTSLYL